MPLQFNLQHIDTGTFDGSLYSNLFTSAAGLPAAFPLCIAVTEIEAPEALARPRTWCTPTPCTLPSVHC